MTTTNTKKIDLADAVQTLEECIQEAGMLNTAFYHDDGKNSPENRVLRDRLLYLSDALLMVSAQVKGEYWSGRVRR